MSEFASKELWLICFWCKVGTFPSLSQACSNMDSKVQLGLLRAGRTSGKLAPVKLESAGLPYGPVNAGQQERPRHPCIPGFSAFRHTTQALIAWSIQWSFCLSIILVPPSPLLLSSSLLHCLLSPLLDEIGTGVWH